MPAIEASNLTKVYRTYRKERGLWGSIKGLFRRRYDETRAADQVSFEIEEGLEARFARHARTNAMVHDWVRRAGFDFFAEEGFRSKTLTCVKNNKGIDVLEFARKLREKHHLVIDPGYGKIRGKTFRLSNMGDETEETVSHLLTCLDDVL